MTTQIRNVGARKIAVYTMGEKDGSRLTLNSEKDVLCGLCKRNEAHTVRCHDAELFYVDTLWDLQMLVAMHQANGLA